MPFFDNLVMTYVFGPPC